MFIYEFNSTLKIEAVCSSETLLPSYQTTRCHNTVMHNTNCHHCKTPIQAILQAVLSIKFLHCQTIKLLSCGGLFWRSICQGIEDITKCVKDYARCLVLLAQAYEGSYVGSDWILWVGFWKVSTSKTKKNMGELQLKKGGTKVWTTFSWLKKVFTDRYMY